MWACKVDLSDAYFHVPLSKRLSRYICVEIDGVYYQFKGMPFGLNIAPEVFMS